MADAEELDVEEVAWGFECTEAWMEVFNDGPRRSAGWDVALIIANGCTGIENEVTRSALNHGEESREAHEEFERLSDAVDFQLIITHR